MVATRPITDSLNSKDAQTCNYAYDDLARLASVNCGTPWSQTFTYDPFGNITKSGSISWLPGYNTANNHYTLAGTSYDANGNLTADTFHTYTWDGNFGNPLSIDTTNLTYDALGRLAETANGTTYTQFVYGPTGKFATMHGQSPNKTFVALPAGDQAVYAGAGTLQGYRHSDWLGSSRIESSTTQTKQFDGAYAPFGESYADSGSYDHVFTGQIPGIVSDLYDFLYREYHAKQGRWIAPDPAGLGAVDPSNPQTWNRYAYVTNNPLAITDMLGLGPGNCLPDMGPGRTGCNGGGSPPWAGGCSSVSSDGGVAAPCTLVLGSQTLSTTFAVNSCGGACGQSWVWNPGSSTNVQLLDSHGNPVFDEKGDQMFAMQITIGGWSVQPSSGGNSSPANNAMEAPWIIREFSLLRVKREWKWWAAGYGTKISIIKLVKPAPWTVEALSGFGIVVMLGATAIDATSPGMPMDPGPSPPPTDSCLLAINWNSPACQ